MSEGNENTNGDFFQKFTNIVLEKNHDLEIDCLKEKGWSTSVAHVIRGSYYTLYSLYNSILYKIPLISVPYVDF
jgi:hypothetical protein